MKTAARLTRNRKELKDVFKIRDAVFGKEQKVPRNIDYDELDKCSKHVILLYKNKPIGCARVRLIKNKAKLERIAVIKKYRGRGFGKIIMKYLIWYCKNRKVKEIYFHSQYYIKDFYRRFGFKTRGKPFMEAGIMHIEMYQKLKSKTRK